MSGITIKEEQPMSSIEAINSITSTVNSTYTSTAKKSEESSEDNSTSSLNSEAAVYTRSDETDTDKVTVKSSNSNSSKKSSKTDNSATIAQIQADAEARVANLKSLVEKLLKGQTNSYAIANSDNDDSIWEHLRKGDFEVDAATKAQAQKDVAEDGYWGVDKTSSRIVDFAIALSGNDSSKADELLEAFKKGYAQAEKTWGGELPEISKKTYDAVLDKFQQWKDGNYVSSDSAV